MMDIKINLDMVYEREKIIKRLKQKLDHFDTWVNELEKSINNLIRLIAKNHFKDVKKELACFLLFFLQEIEKRGFQVRMKKIIEINNKLKILKNIKMNLKTYKT